MSAMEMLAAPAGFDLRRNFVRVTGEREGGFVEFEFAVGEPEVFIEMILTREAFEDFCRTRRPEHLPASAEASPDGAPAGDTDADEFDWRLSDARQRHFRT